MRQIKILAAVAVFSMLASMAIAQRAAPQGQRGAAGQGQRGAAGQGQRGPSPAQMAMMMIHRFDRDGDKALNPQELTAALMAIQQQQMRGQGQQGQQGAGGRGMKGPGGAAGGGKKGPGGAGGGKKGPGGAGGGKKGPGGR